ncbi:BofC C-terminal domain-containing protein [Paenibacillus sp. 1P07SE]|uniref:BofC C-terminal domain-containing protein n=1 Tax=Paenibacillus sp. 1P07SE TaxID=3132209 RepID=UPI0039A486F1
MMALRRWIKIRKRWLRGKKLLSIFGAFLLICGSLFALPADDASAAEPARRQHELEAMLQQSTSWTVKHVRRYICGEEMTALGKLDGPKVRRLLDEHPDWTAKLTSADELVLLEQVEDFSEDCKQGAYFRLDKLGQLSLFEGPPEQERVIRTFFQLDTSYMESSLPKQHWEALTEGIRVNDVEEYQSVLSTFSEYALHASGLDKSPG